MSVYAIGDLQGCYQSLQKLLQRINYRPDCDRLWFCGDLVNRGPDSLAVLRFVSGLGEGAISVLGNHDLHLLAIAFGRAREKHKDTVQQVLEAADGDTLLHWLRHRPLLHHSHRLGYTLVHAGLLPQWSVDKALQLAAEVEAVLRGEEYPELLIKMYGNEPDAWQEHLQGWDRLRVIINAFTRLRYCDQHGRMALDYKGAPGSQPKELLPWFQVPGRQSRAMKIIFGHWSTLNIRGLEHGVMALDTGCIWGGSLTAVRLDEEQPVWYQVACPQARQPGR
jgi:bis(5'-nucleosyl)-tetraphosphatase (symmetrical)